MKNDPSVLILKDGRGNTYKYIYPNDMDQFSKMSTLGNKNSSTVIHLPPGILKSENTSCDTSVSPINQPDLRISSTTSARPRTTNSKNTTSQRKQHSSGSSDIDILSSVLPKPTIRNTEGNNTAVSINSNESTDTSTSIKDCTTEKKEDDNGPHNEPVTTPIANNSSNESSNNTPILCKINNDKYESSNEQDSYKSCDNRNGLILLVENDIKLKLFLNSKGIFGKSSLVNSRKNSMLKPKDEPSTEDDAITNDEVEFPISIGVGE